MKTLFLEWRDVGHLAVADDPTIKEQRWIIRPSATRNSTYELLRVKNGCSTLVDVDKSLPYLQWQAVVSKLNSLNDYVHRASYLLDKKELEASNACMWLLQDAYESGLKDTSTASSQEPTLT